MSRNLHICFAFFVVMMAMVEKKYSFVQRLNGYAEANEALLAAEQAFDREFGYDFYQLALRRFLEKHLMELNLSDADVFTIGKDLVLRRGSSNFDQIVLQQYPGYMAADLEALYAMVDKAGKTSVDAKGNSQGNGIIRQLRQNLRAPIQQLQVAARRLEQFTAPDEDRGWDR